MSAKHEFQAEVKQVLDIVIHSLYTDREIFVRELVSNAADALEKLRHTQLTENNIYEPEQPLEISLTTNEEAGSLTIADHGIGMTREELIENLGTIAHSGSKAFAAALKNSGKSDQAQLIGQFGVGFYAAFMVADEVTVHTHSWRPDAENLLWTSDGATGYTIETTENSTERGCSITLKLKEDAKEFTNPERIKTILKRYSNFVGFPIYLNGERINTVEAIWLKSKDQITDEQYNDFYKFAAHAFDTPKYRLHFQADAPLVINSLLFLPDSNFELMGMGQTEPGVALYCKKVLIDAQPPKLLPDWMRFIRGVIDSEDLPLNISRESMQDSALIRKLGDVVAKRLLKFLDKEAQDSPDTWSEYYSRFSRFFKEGIATDHANRDAIAKLLRFESSLTEPKKVISLPEYVARMKDGQNAIYYQIAPNRDTIESGPYVESFKAKGFEVLYLYETIDEYVISSLREFDGKALQAVNSDEVDLGEPEPAADESSPALSQEATDSLCARLQESLSDNVTTVRPGKRLLSSPALVLTPDGEMNAQMRQMMRAMNKDSDLPPIKVILEINPRHPIITQLAELNQTEDQKATADLIAAQILDNAMLSAGLLDNPQRIVARTQSIMELLLKKNSSQ